MGKFGDERFRLLRYELLFLKFELKHLVLFSGLMLAVAEDIGLAEGTKKGNFDVQSLLTYSAVYGANVR